MESGFDKITLIPRRGVLTSRSEANTSIKIHETVFRLPVVPSNMMCTINFELAEQLIKNNYLYVLHRMYDYKDIYNWVKYMKKNNLYVSISVGVKGKDYEFLSSLIQDELYPDLICIDVAHGHSELVRKMITWIMGHTKGKNVGIIAGNTCTAEGVIDLNEWGADIVKFGIAPGHACSTYTKTGFGRSQVKGLIEAYKSFGIGTIMADGGIRNNGDIAKAMCCGAKMVMCGSLFAGCKDSPAPKNDGKVEYFGSASATCKEKTGQPVKHIEGFTQIIPETKMTYLEKLEEIEQDLKSAVSYAGGSSTLTFQDVKVERL